MNIRYKIKIAYDGTDFVGWQRQPNGRSIQSILETTFYKLFNQMPFILSASRTDAGVHASEQVAIVDFENLNLSPKNLFAAWNIALPGSVFISEYELAPGFNPHIGVQIKEYEYILLKTKNPFFDRTAWFYPLGYKINWIDFQAFLEVLSTSQTNQPKNYQDFYKKEIGLEKELNMEIKITLFQKNDDPIVKIQFEGRSFLRHQLRRIVGGAVQYSISKNKFNLSDVEDSLNGLQVHPSKLPIFTAAAQGLCLKKIIYKKDYI